MSKLFTKEEDQFIIDNYGKLTGAEIGRKLGRTKGTIYYRFQVLGLNTKAKRRGDLTGQKFNMLTVLGPAEATRKGYKKWLCECDCGNKKAVLATHLVSGKIKSCSCLQKRNGKEHPNFKGHGEIHLKHYEAIKNSANVRGSSYGRDSIPFGVSIEFLWDLFLKQERKCALSGLPIGFPQISTGNKTASLDRIDSSKGYTEDNVQWVHKDINLMKRTYSIEYFTELCKKVVENLDK
jgi:hypothetical protein